VGTKKPIVKRIRQTNYIRDLNDSNRIEQYDNENSDEHKMGLRWGKSDRLIIMEFIKKEIYNHSKSCLRTKWERRKMTMKKY